MVFHGFPLPRILTVSSCLTDVFEASSSHRLGSQDSHLIFYKKYAEANRSQHPRNCFKLKPSCFETGTTGRWSTLTLLPSLSLCVVSVSFCVSLSLSLCLNCSQDERLFPHSLLTVAVACHVMNICTFVELVQDASSPEQSDFDIDRDVSSNATTAVSPQTPESLQGFERFDAELSLSELLAQVWKYG